MKSIKKIKQQREHSQLKKERRIFNVGYSRLSSAEHKRRAYEKEQEKERKVNFEYEQMLNALVTQ